MPVRARRVVAGAVLLQLTLGSVHAWSVFRAPLQDATGWSTPQITFAYTLAIFTLGCSASLSGPAVRSFGRELRIPAIHAGSQIGSGPAVFTDAAFARLA